MRQRRTGSLSTPVKKKKKQAEPQTLQVEMCINTA